MLEESGGEKKGPRQGRTQDQDKEEEGRRQMSGCDGWRLAWPEEEQVHSLKGKASSAIERTV